MLNEFEERKVQLLLNLTITEATSDSDWYVETVKWLTAKLLEVNDECSKVHEELYTANSEIARINEAYNW